MHSFEQLNPPYQMPLVKAYLGVNGCNGKTRQIKLFGEF